MAKAEPLIPRNQHPEYVQATDEIAKLRATLVPVQGRLRELELLLHEHTPEAERISGHVEAALHFAETGAVRRPIDAESYGEEHLLLRQQAEALTSLIDTKQRALYDIEAKLSARVLAAKLSEHDDIRRRYVAMLRELDAVRKEEQTFLNDLAAQGYHLSLPNPVEWFVLGRLDDPQSLIAARVRELSTR